MLQHGTCNFWGEIVFTRSIDLGLDWKFKMVTQRSTSNFRWNSDEENITTCKVTTWCRQILRHHHIHKELHHAAIWLWPNSKGQKGQTKVNIKLVQDYDVENISVKLQHDACNCWGVIMFTRQPDFEQVWKQNTIKLQLDTGNWWRVIIFTRSF